MLINNVKIGTDPELFLFSEKDNKFITACGKIGGTKEKPIPITKENDGFTIQEDNVAAEFTIPPANNLKEWLDNINFVKDYISETILKPKGLVPKYISSTRFDERDLDNKQAQTMGCDTSYNAYTFMPHEVDRSDYTLRTTGFHVHVGYNSPDPEKTLNLIKCLDLFLGVPSVLMDLDDERRKMYGKAGDWRLKEYGGEYRTLGGFFLKNDETLSWVYKNTLCAIDFLNKGIAIEDTEDIIQSIDNVDRKKALKIIKKYKINILNYEQIQI